MDYKSTKEKFFTEFQRLLTDENGWELQKEQDGCTVYSVMTPFSTKSNCYKCTFDIDLSPRRTIDTVHFFGPYRPQFDPHFSKTEILEKLDETSIIGHFVGKKTILGVSLSGDYVNLFTMGKTEKYIYSVYGSVDYNKDNLHGVGIRGWMHPSGIAAFHTENPEKTKAVIIFHSEFKNLPGFLVRSVIEKSSVTGVLQYIEQLRATKTSLANYQPLGKEVVMCNNY